MATIKQYENKRTGEKLWLFKTYLGTDPITGKQITTTRRGFKTKKEAVLNEKRLKVEYEENGGLKKQLPSNTYNELYLLWLETYKQTVKEASLMTTEGIFKNYILPAFGSSPIDKIDVKTCQKAVNAWSTQRKNFKIIIIHASRVFKYALNMGLVPFNPLDRVIRPQRRETTENKFKFYSKEQLQTMLDFLEENIRDKRNKTLFSQFNAERNYALVRLLAFSGLRIGEACALTFDDINFSDNTITVNKTISKSKKGSVVSSPKTKSSNRTIPLDFKTMKALKRWQLKQKEFLFSNRVKDCEIVFPLMDGKHLFIPSCTNMLDKLAKKASLPPIGCHGYRHTHASLLFEAGATMKEVQVRLGHSSIAMAQNIYIHVSKQVTVQTVEKLVKLADF